MLSVKGNNANHMLADIFEIILLRACEKCGKRKHAQGQRNT